MILTGGNLNFEAATFALDCKVQGPLQRTLRIHSEKHKFFGVSIAGKAYSAKVWGEICDARFKNRQNNRRHSIVRFLDSEKLAFFGVDGGCAFTDPCTRQKHTFFATQSEQGAP